VNISTRHDPKIGKEKAMKGDLRHQGTKEAKAKEPSPMSKN